MSRYYIPGTPAYFLEKNRVESGVEWHKPEIPIDALHPGTSDGKGVAIPNYDPDIAAQLEEMYPDIDPATFESPDNYDSSYKVKWNKLYLELGFAVVGVLLIVTLVDKAV